MRFKTIRVRRAGLVATIRMLDRAQLPFGPDWDPHLELCQAFSALRTNDRVRVIVLTGTGSTFHRPPPTAYTSKAYRAYRNDPRNLWLTFSSIVRLHETMAASEKPIVARVNGDAIGFGSSLVFACDLIVAQEDAVFADPHLVPAATSGSKVPGMVPGDGGAAIVPLLMGPARAKEYLMLGAQWSAGELARLGIINYAVPAARLDHVVKDLVARLVARPAYSLAWTKRVVNRPMVDQLARTLDTAAAYEMVDFLEWERDGFRQRSHLI